MGIPIAGENNGDSEDEYWHSDENTVFTQNAVFVTSKTDQKDLQSEGWSPTVNEEAATHIAFTIGPIKDGIVLEIAKPKPISLTLTVTNLFRMNSMRNVIKTPNQSSISAWLPN